LKIRHGKTLGNYFDIFHTKIFRYLISEKESEENLCDLFLGKALKTLFNLISPSKKSKLS